MGKKRNKKRLQALSKQKLVDTNASAPTLPMKVATNATPEDHNFYDKSQIRQRIAENLREKNVILEEKRVYEELTRKNEERLQKELQEKKKLEENTKKLEGQKEYFQEQEDCLQEKMQCLQELLGGKQKLVDTNATAPTLQMKVATNATTEDHNFYDLEDRFMAQRQIVENLRELLNQKMEYLQEQKVSQQVVFVDTKTVEIEEEEVTEMLQVHTHSEQASVKIHLDEFMETCSVSKPIVLKQQVYNEVNMEEEEIQDI